MSTEEAQPLCGVTASPFPIRKPGFSVHVSAALDSEVDVAQERLVDLRAAAETSALDDQQKLMEEHAVASGLAHVHVAGAGGRQGAEGGAGQEASADGEEEEGACTCRRGIERVRTNSRTTLDLIPIPRSMPLRGLRRANHGGRPSRRVLKRRQPRQQQRL